MIIRPFLLILLFYVVSCSSRKDIEFQVEQATQEIFESAKSIYKSSLLQDTANHQKRNGILNLPLTIKPEVYMTFTDSIRGIEDESRVEYSYIGQFRDLGFYVLMISYWEHAQVILVNKETGDLYNNVWSLPILSPNNKFMASFLSDGLEGEPVGIQILSVDTQSYNKIQKKIEIDQRLWNPIDIVWDEHDNLIIKAIEYENPPGNSMRKENVYQYIKITF